jgi:hypothetical protein
MADALRAELSRQWGAEYDNYVRDVDWPLMAQAALNAHRGHYRPVIGSPGPVAQARMQLSGLMAATTPDEADLEALAFLLDLMDSGWHPHGFRLLMQRDKLYNALGDALQAMRGAAGYVDDAAVQRVTAVMDELGGDTP